jgi:xanthine dehydrogenase accessory factor
MAGRTFVWRKNQGLCRKAGVGHLDPHSLKKLNAERRARRAAVLVTNLDDGRDRVICEGDQVAGELGEAIAAAFRSGKSRIAEADGTRFFLNAQLPPARIIVIGAVHISQAMAPMAQIAGFDVTIIDPRTAFASAERFPDVDLRSEWPEDVLRAVPLDGYTALVAVTHDPKIDDYPIKEALEAGSFYVGALGSRKTHSKRVERLLEAGLSQRQIDKIHAPIGLDIGAASPAEIAVAILAEIIKALRSRRTARAASEVAA